MNIVRNFQINCLRIIMNLDKKSAFLITSLIFQITFVYSQDSLRIISELSFETKGQHSTER